MEKEIDRNLIASSLEFEVYAARRMEQIFRSEKLDLSFMDDEYDRLQEKAEIDDRYFSAYIPYLAYKYNNALLLEDKRERENQIFALWRLLKMDYIVFRNVDYLEQSGLLYQIHVAVRQILLEKYICQKLKRKQK